VIAHLERLDHADRTRRTALRADLARAVAGLDGLPSPDDVDSDPQATGRALPPARPAGRSAPTSQEMAALPRRTTHGGGFGPKVRAKLIAEMRMRGL
jgi:hypothetical protein